MQGSVNPQPHLCIGGDAGSNLQRTTKVHLRQCLESIDQPQGVFAAPGFQPSGTLNHAFKQTQRELASVPEFASLLIPCT